MRLLNPGLVIVVFMSAAAFVGCSGGQASTNTVSNSGIQNTAANTSRATTDTGKIGYPPQVVDDFVRGCDGQGAKPELCKCLFDKIQQKYSFAEFQAIGSEINAGRPPNHFVEL